MFSWIILIQFLLSKFCDSYMNPKYNIKESNKEGNYKLETVNTTCTPACLSKEELRDFRHSPRCKCFNGMLRNVDCYLVTCLLCAGPIV
jgi:hypothetical protein